ncbi:unnamed protein product [Vitrella brassicaformis CCMP3155]|uniref:Protein kinase domain-containing protein n=1 Tax=Vitrella brassicaformis (strain CCMP3155) TaxID=1169540 RepID=A0A0G4F3Z8_VITBC|nr:unnamed protein product [Vitrella brassicaformis CCMP3155]|eukprot:CEM06641.1 unnamed protein product [Vitrella brassicaformis CCMP3155]
MSVENQDNLRLIWASRDAADVARAQAARKRYDDVTKRVDIVRAIAAAINEDGFATRAQGEVIDLLTKELRMVMGGPEDYPDLDRIIWDAYSGVKAELQKRRAAAEPAAKADPMMCRLSTGYINGWDLAAEAGVCHDNIIKAPHILAVRSPHAAVKLAVMCNGWTMADPAFTGGIGDDREFVLMPLMQQALSGLRHLHKRGLIHTDIEVRQRALTTFSS